MSRAFELILKQDFRDLIAVYISSFAHSYAKLDNRPVDFAKELQIYNGVINSKVEDIVRAAAFGISGYSNLYKVMPRDTFDEFKIIYYLGMAIEAQLSAAGHVKIAQVHMFTMIGLLDEALKNRRVSKPTLTAAMTQLVRFNRFKKELGNTGCYLIYKCSSTAPGHVTGIVVKQPAANTPPMSATAVTP